MRPSVLIFLVATIGCAGAVEPASLSIDGIVFGPRKHFSGVYFSNFENSRFTACSSDKDECRKPAETDEAVLSCIPAACADIESRIKKLVGSHDKWAEYRIEFLGRWSLNKTAKRFIGDTENKAYLEKIENFRLLKTESVTR